MDNDNKTAVRPKLESMVRASNARAIKDGAAGRTAARKAYRAKIESLLDESSDERLANMWQRVYRFPVEVPDRRAIIEDLADLAEALQPSLDGMKAERLCWLIERYAARKSRQSDRSASSPSTAPPAPWYALSCGCCGR